eukprot:9469335-Pyramimonas_sp.AAC.1
MGGLTPARPSLIDALQSRAKMKTNTAAGADGCPPEVYKSPPRVHAVRTWQRFHQRVSNISISSPGTWKLIEYTGAPTESQADSFD